MPDTRTLLERELDDAIRKGLVDAGHKGPLYEYVGAILPHVVRAVQAIEPTGDEVVEDIRKHGGFMRAGDDMVMSDGRHVPPRLLTDAVLRLWREQEVRS